jgi:hypothetical protein
MARPYGLIGEHERIREDVIALAREALDQVQIPVDQSRPAERIDRLAAREALAKNLHIRT